MREDLTLKIDFIRAAVLALLACIIATGACAIDIYKCPNLVYTNDRAMAQAHGCQRLASVTDPISKTGAQEVVIKRSDDGHFWMNGEIGGKPVRFMVDTGATVVAVSEAFAASAHLTGGRPILMNTAGGNRTGRLIEGVPVTASIFTVPRVKVSVGLSGFGSNEALLGQSFLSQFEMTMDDEQLVLRNKKR